MRINSQEDKLLADAILYGSCVYLTKIRPWWSPMRWIKGKIYRQRIRPTDFITSRTRE